MENILSSLHINCVYGSQGPDIVGKQYIVTGMRGYISGTKCSIFQLYTSWNHEFSIPSHLHGKILEWLESLKEYMIHTGADGHNIKVYTKNDIIIVVDSEDSYKIKNILVTSRKDLIPCNEGILSVRCRGNMYRIYIPDSNAYYSILGWKYGY